MPHTSTEQPEALKVADLFESWAKLRGENELGSHTRGYLELRRLHARVQELEAQAAEEAEATDNWRRLALQFDNHRMQALGHLRELVRIDDGYAEAKSAEQFLAAPPLDGEAVLAQRIAALAAATQPAAQGMDANNSIGTLWVKENDENTLQLCQSAAPKLAPGEYALFAQAKQGVA